jgi:hypothetical protein
MWKLWGRRILSKNLCLIDFLELEGMKTKMSSYTYLNNEGVFRNETNKLVFPEPAFPKKTVKLLLFINEVIS